MRPSRDALGAVWIAIAALAIAALPATSAHKGEQRGIPAPGKRISLKIGVVTVWLGMPKGAAQEEFAKQGYNLAPPGDSSLVVQGEGKEARHIGHVSFRNGRLVHASQYWPGGDNSFESAFAALTSFARQGSSVCTLSEEPLLEPGFQMNRLWISCGDRTLFLTEVTVPEKSRGVDEWIGQPPK
jgi:hypothetical protein